MSFHIHFNSPYIGFALFAIIPMEKLVTKIPSD